MIHKSTKQLNRQIQATEAAGRYFYLHRHITNSQTYSNPIRIIRVRSIKGVRSALSLNSGQWIVFDCLVDYFSDMTQRYHDQCFPKESL